MVEECAKSIHNTVERCSSLPDNPSSITVDTLSGSSLVSPLISPEKLLQTSVNVIQSVPTSPMIGSPLRSMPIVCSSDNLAYISSDQTRPSTSFRSRSSQERGVSCNKVDTTIKPMIKAEMSNFSSSNTDDKNNNVIFNYDGFYHFILIIVSILILIILILLCIPYYIWIRLFLSISSSYYDL